jgi:hypothetical protein
MKYSFIKNSGVCVARKLRCHSLNRDSRPISDRRRPPGIDCFQIGKSLPQTSCVKLIDGKHCGATLRTSWAADQKLATTDSNVRQSSVHNLDQLSIPRGYNRQGHALRIPQRNFGEYRCERSTASREGKWRQCRVRLQQYSLALTGHANVADPAFAPQRGKDIVLTRWTKWKWNQRCDIGPVQPEIGVHVLHGLTACPTLALELRLG